MEEPRIIVPLGAHCSRLITGYGPRAKVEDIHTTACSGHSIEELLPEGLSREPRRITRDDARRLR